jgi:hypothetical protein
MEWSYLTSEPFKLRYVLAAHFVRACPDVIEIGGYKTPIDYYLTGYHTSVTVLDPLIQVYSGKYLNGKACYVQHLPIPFQDYNNYPPKDYGLVIIGMEIHGELVALYELVARSAVTVIEFASDFAPACEQYIALRLATKRKPKLNLKLDLGGNDFGDLTGSWQPRTRREMHVL